VDRLGPTYTPPVAQFSATTIPVAGSITMTMNQVYTLATGAAGNQNISVHVRDTDGGASQLLDAKTIVYARPANCFTGILIGPGTTTSTLSNTDGIVTGPSGSSEEAEAEVFYKIDANQFSPDTAITAAQE
jgi:hypothetical protein